MTKTNLYILFHPKLDEIRGVYTTCARAIEQQKRYQDEGGHYPTVIEHAILDEEYDDD